VYKRQVNYTAVATSRFKEYFHVNAMESVALSGTAPKSLGHAGVVVHSESVAKGDGSVTYTRDTDYTIDYAAGTMTRVATGAIASDEALTVVYAYLSVPVTRETAAPATVDILNSARPAAPKVLYMVPTFGWTKAEYESGVVINRSGGGLRVYLDRPWFSSGDGELLGAVVWAPAPARLSVSAIVPALLAPPDKARLYVTQWGMDPIWLSTPTRPSPALSDFPRAVKTATGLSLDELPGTGVAVAGHTVGYDEERKLWYCDLDVNTGDSYYPFVRLALVRYQPNSVPDAHLSRVSLADFAQLAPDRQASITIDPDLPTQMAVSLCGPGYTASGVGKGTSEVEVSIETRRTDVPEEVGWIPVPNGTFPLAVTKVRDSEIIWSGPVTLPEPRGSKPFRLVIKEYERFAADAGGSVFLAAAAVGRGSTVRRLVYASVLEI